MITLDKASRKRKQPEECDETAPPVAHAGSPWLVVFFLMLAGYLLFAHGCHADEDTELRVREFIACLSR